MKVFIYNNSCVRERREEKTILFVLKRFPGCGSAWLERLVWDQEVAGSNPVTPMNHTTS